MKRSLLFIVFLAAALLQAPAQQATNDANPLMRFTSIRTGTISVPPITGVPFSATAIVENKQTLPDGTIAVAHNLNLIGRDSRGRTHGEMRRWVPASSKDEPPLSEVHLYDPQTSVSTVYYPATHVATRRTQIAPRDTSDLPPPAGPQVTVEDLGRTTMSNIDVNCTRRTVVIPAQANNTGAPITVVDQYCYSPDLHVNMMLLHNDPRTGEQTVVLSNLKREDPDASFFQVPDDYKIVDLTPPLNVQTQRDAANGGRR
jgi:hypothetical protein